MDFRDLEAKKGMAEDEETFNVPVSLSQKVHFMFLSIQYLT